ncbi:AAA family ATPase [Clostridium sp. FP1]|uniref:AAA family ATPase n=1 Tax=Clostridium sp. FP1 TaxID=2724076 RepID=UPI0013E9447E|nr:AAA family ATPase [Clostridium sp. FP1]MBZ9634627.1 AAA family ATPase [Clostridium sp. FP1]
MIYLKKFKLPSFSQEEDNNLTPHAYPYGIFPFKEFEDIGFKPITIFYGGNGSGKSTLLNLISGRLNLPRTTPFNSSELFSEYIKTKCDYATDFDEDGLPLEIPLGSKIITSEDVFNHILTVRNENCRIDKAKTLQQQQYYEAKYSKIQFNSMNDYEQLKMQNTVRNQTCSRFVRDRTDQSIEQFSNGETALSYFDNKFESGNLYLLDEPENSLSPKFQLQLAKLIIDCAYYCNCQFIIATHSPFILSIDGAQIYDLDSTPVRVRNWHDLENVRIYYEFFKEYNNLFE